MTSISFLLCVLGDCLHGKKIIDGSLGTLVSIHFMFCLKTMNYNPTMHDDEAHAEQYTRPLNPNTYTLSPKTSRPNP